MSHTFDALQQGLEHLDRQPGNTTQTSDVIRCMKQIVDSLHDYAHSEGHRSRLNFAGGRGVALLDTCLRHADDEDREFWLEVKSKA